MATLQGQQIKNSYKDLLQVSNSNSGVDGTLRNVEDGEGTVSALQLSSSAAKVAGNLTVTGNVVFNDGTSISTAPTGGSSLTISDEGSDLSTATTKIDFVGSGVTASGSGATKTITIPGGSSGITVQEEGSSLSTLGTTLNFVGSGVTASGTGATKTITVSGGGGGGISNVVEDTSPQLGGALDVQTNYIITATSNRNVEVAAHGTGKFVVRGNTNPGAIALNCENNSHAIVVKSPNHASGGNYELTLPTADAAGALVSNGSGTLSFNTQLGTIGGLSNADGNFIVGTGSAFTVESGATARTSLGLGTMAVAATSDYVAKAGSTMTGQLVLHSTGIQFSDSTTLTTAPTSGVSAGKAIALAMIFGG